MYEIFRDGWQWATKQMVNFFVAIRITDPDIRIRIAAVRRALAEICTVPVLLVHVGPCLGMNK